MTASESGKKIALIACGDAEKWGWAEAYLERYVGLFERDNDTTKGFVACRDEVPTTADLEKFDGFIFSGSISSANDDDEWIKKTKKFILEASKHEKRPKIAGICFGHQLIASALGGKIGYNPSKDFVLKSEEIKACSDEKVIEKAALSTLFKNGSIRLLESHSECISELPEGAKTLATSETCEHEIVLFNDNILGVQGHPDLFPGEVNDMILPSVSQKFGWDEERQNELRNTFYLPLNSEETNKAIIEFIRR